MTLQILNDPVSFVRSHPGNFLRIVPARAYELAGNLACDAAILGACPVTIDRIEDWWVVAAKEDWLAKGNPVSREESFGRIIPFPQAGANSHRAEILLTAFAEEVFTYKGEQKYLVKSTAGPDGRIEEELLRKYPGYRIIAFRMADDGARG